MVTVLKLGVKLPFSPPVARISRKARAGLYAFVAAWALTLGVGFRQVLAHATTPGKSGDVLGAWPEAVQLPRAKDRAELVMLVHPRCPCTKSALHELARLLPRIGSRAHTTILIQVPEGGDVSDWENGESWRIARSIPGVSVVADRGGKETARFGARTSGHVLVYDKAGRLLFTGGITPGRGHEGAAEGQTRIMNALSTGERSPTVRVFGCELF
jgi:hypothetical protein